MLRPDEDGQTIHLTRGDASGEFNKLAFYRPIYNYKTKQEENYKFQLDDKISFVVKEKRGYTKPEILRVEKTLREMGYAEPTEYPEIILTEEDTKVFELLDKKKIYWYDIVLNDSDTIIGYDEDGAKKLIVYPEAGEKGENNE